MTPRPLHTINGSQPSIAYSNNDVESAARRFHDNISNGISVLVRRHGYSRERAASLILDQIRQSDDPPNEEEVSRRINESTPLFSQHVVALLEDQKWALCWWYIFFSITLNWHFSIWTFQTQVFRVMHHLGLGLDEARQCIIVASALKRIQDQRGVQKVGAIDYLSSCLTTMKLLGTVEKTVVVKQSPVATSSPSSTISEEFISSSLVQSSPPTTNKSISPARDRTKTVCTTTSGRRKNAKNLKTRQAPKPSKPQRKRSKEEDKSTSDKVDAQVVEKALLANCKTSSPGVRQAGKRLGGSHREEIDDQSQPAPKRQRLDSVWFCRASFWCLCISRNTAVLWLLEWNSANRNCQL